GGGRPSSCLHPVGGRLAGMAPDPQTQPGRGADVPDRLAEVARRLEECVAVLERESGLRPWRVPDRDNIDGAHPYYGEDDGRLFVRAHERGKLVRDEVHESVDGVVESLVTDMAAQLARTYEARHRRPREDSRRQWFHLSELWLSRVELAWGDRLHSDHVAVLRESPFNDDRDVP
ncbi:hypothetical protein M3B33_12610, partial [Janibacter hoylei]|uniref:hypothetical protein n=2 Tax=Janibacter hoylei TaxID=364298 RepID=UPI0021A32946